MNWKKSPQPQLDDEQRISRVTRSIAADATLTNYAPKHMRPTIIEQEAGSFDDLVTKEIDDTIKAAEDELAALKEDGNRIKRAYTKHTADLQLRLKRLRDGGALSRKMFAELYEHIAKLDDVPEANEVPPVEEPVGP